MTTRIALLIVAALVLAGGIYVFVSPKGVSFMARELGGMQRRWLLEESINFLEDLQFKDFENAATHHLPQGEKKRDIAALIKSKFKIDHELLDILKYEVTEVDLDRSQKRARVRVEVQARALGPSDVRDHKKSHQTLELLLYWFEQPDGSWGLELR